ncbi:FHA domain-containing protein [Streptomyces sp. NPDC059009]|uniref:FHA domain-containing protein n=1 Tax=Streptomyces sp. NPDC059009 TaxID=3346694 RepID=UPI00367C94A7
MQIRLTVLGSRSGQTEPQGRPAPPHACDVLVTAPTGTALAAIASGLATAAGGDGPAVLYVGQERLDPQRSTLGEPPLLDGAVLSLGAPAEPGPELAGAAAQLRVVAGPDAGGVHLLHGGQIRVGRSAEADVALDDPDVSRLHCAVTLAPDGQVSVTDLGSTNGTSVDGTEITDRPVRLAPGSLLRLGESALRLAAGTEAEATLATAADGEGHVRVRTAGTPESPSSPSPASPASPASPSPSSPQGPPSQATHHAYGSADWGSSVGGTPPDGVRPRTPEPPLVPQQGGAPEAEHTRVGTPVRGTPVPRGARKRGGLSAWARRLTGSRDETREEPAYEAGYGPQGDPPPHDQHDPATPEDPAVAAAARTPESWPDPAALLLTALGPGPRLWERGPAHPETLAVRLGTVDRAAPGSGGPGPLLPAVPVTVSLREAGALGLAGPRERLSGLGRAVVAQLAALHSPDSLEIVLLSTDRARPLQERTAAWGWLGWLPHLRPAHGQDCRLLLAYDREQAAARTGELLRRLDDHIEGNSGGRNGSWAPAGFSGRRSPAGDGPFTVLVVDGDPGSAGLREATVRLARDGARAGIHVVCLAETPAASPASPVPSTYEAACSVTPAFRACGAVALLSGDVATALRLLRTADGHPAGHGTVAALDAVSAAWAERFARSLAPLRPDGVPGEGHARVSAPLPQSARLLDELGLARATPASLMARWAAAADDPEALGGRAWPVLGAGPRGPVAVDLATEGPHLLIEGPTGSGRTELLRSVAASLAAAERPDRLGLVLIDGRDSGSGTSGGNGGIERGAEGLRVCTDLPHVTTHLNANDPVRMREFAQSLTAELKRRAELLGRLGFGEWHTRREVSGRMVAQRAGGDGAGDAGPLSPSGRTPSVPAPSGRTPSVSAPSGRTPSVPGPAVPGPSGADIEAPPSATLRLRPGGRARPEPGPPLPRLVVLVDDFDALLSPALGSPGRPAAGSVVRALESVARDGERLGVHLVAAVGPGGRAAETELARGAGLRVALDAPAAGPEDPAPGRGELVRVAEGRVTPFQAGRVTGRIPRTATLRPTVVPLEWERMGDPPARRPVRELGNGPTDLALLASALERAAGSVAVAEVAPLL